MRSLTSHIQNGLENHQNIHPGPVDNLHDLTSEINPGAPVSVPNMYYFADPNLSVPMMNYQYAMPQEQMDLAYMLSGGMSLSSDNLLDEPSQAGPSDLQKSELPPDLAALPISSGTEYITPTHPVPTPRQSPFQEVTQSPTPASFTSSAQTSGHAHTMLPPMVHPDPNDPESKFGADSRTFNKRVNSGASTEADPYAAAFIQDRLGDAKWNIFSARLFERRLGVAKPGSKQRDNDSADGDSKIGGGASAIDFLVKVEVVKEILRTYVPHPYNPLKSLKHEFEAAPSGEVTLTRSTVLSLSGWSNTQFSYWARRIEAVSVLAVHDDRLRAVSSVLERKLRGELGADLSSDPSDEDRSDTPASASSSFSGQEGDYAQSVTGKGLDNIIDEVKKRTGASQFLRGKHSSLDPFGAINIEVTGGGLEAPAPVYMPTFQATEYTHSLPPSNSEQQDKRKPRTRINKKANTEPAAGSWIGSSSIPQANVHINSSIDPAIPSLSYNISNPPQFSSAEQYILQQPLPPTFIPHYTSVDAMPRSQRPIAMSSAPQMNLSRGHHQKNSSKESEHSSSRRELFPVSDSRSELENMPQGFKRAGEAIEAPFKKRTRQSEML